MEALQQLSSFWNIVTGNSFLETRLWASRNKDWRMNKSRLLYKDNNISQHFLFRKKMEWKYGCKGLASIFINFTHKQYKVPI